MIGLSGSDLEMETWTLLSGRTLRSCHLWNNIIAEPETETGSWVSVRGGGGGVTLCNSETLCNTEILCNTLHDLGRRSCNTLSSCRLFLAETDTAGDSSDILTTKQETQFQSGLKSTRDKKEVSIPTQGDLCYSLEIFGNNLC